METPILLLLLSLNELLHNERASLLTRTLRAVHELKDLGALTGSRGVGLLYAFGSLGMHLCVWLWMLNEPGSLAVAEAGDSPCPAEDAEGLLEGGEAMTGPRLCWITACDRRIGTPITTM